LDALFAREGWTVADDLKMRGDITMEVYRRVLARKTATNKELTDVERQAVIDNVVIDKVFVSKKAWKDSKKYTFRLDKDEQKKAYVVIEDEKGQEQIYYPYRIGMVDRKKIIDALIATGRYVNEVNIVNEYLNQYPKMRKYLGP